MAITATKAKEYIEDLSGKAGLSKQILEGMTKEGAFPETMNTVKSGADDWIVPFMEQFIASKEMSEEFKKNKRLKEAKELLNNWGDDDSPECLQARVDFYALAIDQASNVLAKNQAEGAKKILVKSFKEAAKIEKIGDFFGKIEAWLNEKNVDNKKILKEKIKVHTATEALDQAVVIAKGCAELAKDGVNLSLSTVVTLKALAIAIPVIVAKETMMFALAEEWASRSIKNDFANSIENPKERAAWKISWDRNISTVGRRIAQKIGECGKWMLIASRLFEETDFPSDEELREQSNDRVADELRSICPFFDSKNQRQIKQLWDYSKECSSEVKSWSEDQISTVTYAQNQSKKLNEAIVTLVDHPSLLTEENYRILLESKAFSSSEEMLIQMKQFIDLDKEERKPAFKSNEERNVFFADPDRQKAIDSYLSDGNSSNFKTSSEIRIGEILKKFEEEKLNPDGFATRQVNLLHLSNQSYVNSYHGVIKSQQMHSVDEQGFNQIQALISKQQKNPDSNRLLTSDRDGLDGALNEELVAVRLLNTIQMKARKQLGDVNSSHPLREGNEMAISESIARDICKAYESILTKAIESGDPGDKRVASVFMTILARGSMQQISPVSLLEGNPEWRSGSLQDISNLCVDLKTAANVLTDSKNVTSTDFSSEIKSLVDSMDRYANSIIDSQIVKYEKSSLQYLGTTDSPAFFELCEVVSKKIGQDITPSFNDGMGFETLKLVLNSGEFGSLPIEMVSKRILEDQNAMKVVSVMMKAVQKGGGYGWHEDNSRAENDSKEKLGRVIQKVANENVPFQKLSDFQNPVSGLLKFAVTQAFPEEDLSNDIRRKSREVNKVRYGFQEKLAELINHSYETQSFNKRQDLPKDHLQVLLTGKINDLRKGLGLIQSNVAGPVVRSSKL